MNKIIRYYNSNRREIFIIIIIIVIIIVLLKFVNLKVKENNEKKLANILQVNTSTSVEKNKQQSIITGKQNEVSGKKDIETITEFIEYCNSGDTQSAYNLLSDDCKNEIFPTIEYFVDNYYKNNFATEKIFNIQNWVSTTYKVDLKENNIYTGNINGSSIQDFITVVKQENENKININNYIGKKNIEKEENNQNLNIKVIEKNIYTKYEIYTLEIKNDNNYKVILDNLNTTDGIYITGDNQMKYSAYTHELSKEELMLDNKSVIKVRIKFANSYVKDREINKITFAKVIINEDEDNLTSISVGL